MEYIKIPPFRGNAAGEDAKEFLEYVEFVKEKRTTDKSDTEVLRKKSILAFWHHLHPEGDAHHWWRNIVTPADKENFVTVLGALWRRGFSPGSTGPDPDDTGSGPDGTGPGEDAGGTGTAGGFNQSARKASASLNSAVSQFSADRNLNSVDKRNEDAAEDEPPRKKAYREEVGS
jgi:hypothetical protein